MYVCERRVEGSRSTRVRLFCMLLFRLFYKYKESNFLSCKFIKKFLNEYK